MFQTRLRRFLVFSGVSLVSCLLLFNGTPPPKIVINDDKIAEALQTPLNENLFPPELTLKNDDGKPSIYKVDYTLDWTLQGEMNRIFKSYRPDYGAFVAVEIPSGRVLSLISYTKDPSSLGNLTLRSTFPAASLFKIVTAAAALDQKQITPTTIIPFNGGEHTLYKRNVTSFSSNRYSKHMTVSEAFARSVNSVFAKLGLYFLQPKQLADYAARFQFNQPIVTDLPVGKALFQVTDDDDWNMAEVSSGFSQSVSLSPVHGALLAAAVANDGVLIQPHLVETLQSGDSDFFYHAEPRLMNRAISIESAQALRAMMQETVKIGTSRKAFRDLMRKKKFQDLEVGGKTGSLGGVSPKGKYDWFVGYASKEGRKVAIAALTINGLKWRIKASHLARLFIEKYY